MVAAGMRRLRQDERKMAVPKSLFAGNLEARNPPGSWVMMYPQKKDASTYPIVSGLQWNSLISVTSPFSLVVLDIILTCATPTLQRIPNEIMNPTITRIA